MKELDPICFKGRIGMAITNNGELIPCCRLDDGRARYNDPEFQKLLAVSKISDYDSIDDILETKEWKLFYENLRNHIGPKPCWRTCGKNKSSDQVQTVSFINTGPAQQDETTQKR